jgi:hypothetical protein
MGVHCKLFHLGTPLEHNCAKFTLILLGNQHVTVYGMGDFASNFGISNLFGEISI